MEFSNDLRRHRTERRRRVGSESFAVRTCGEYWSCVRAHGWSTGEANPVWAVRRHPRCRAYTETSRCPTWLAAVRTSRDAVTPVVIPVSWSGAEVALCSPAASVFDRSSRLARLPRRDRECRHRRAAASAGRSRDVGTYGGEWMVNAAVVPELVKAGKSYARDVSALITAGSTTEASYYPAIKAFVAAALAAEALPFDVRVNTSERKPGAVSIFRTSPYMTLVACSSQFAARSSFPIRSLKSLPCRRMARIRSGVTWLLRGPCSSPMCVRSAS